MLKIQRYIHADVLPIELGGDFIIPDKSWLYNALHEREVLHEKRSRSRSKKIVYFRPFGHGR